MQNNPLNKIQSIISPWQEKVKDLFSKIKDQFGRDRSVIGIDVGTSSVKVIQMENVDGKLTAVKSAFVDIGGVPGSQEEALASLKTALIGIDTTGAKVVAIVNCLQTCTRKIVAPHMPKKELTQAVRWEAKNAIPFSIDEALMDFEILGEVADKNTRKLVVAVAAAPKGTVNKLLSLFFKADVEISALIPVSLSLQNLIATSKGQDQEIIAIVEMGASVTELNIYREGQLAFSRKLPVAGDDITKAMTSTLMSSQGKVELSLEEAEKIKKECGIPTGEATELVDGKILPSHILSLVRPCVEQLAGEIERSFDFFREEAQGGQVSKIVLYGGGANLKGLAASLKGELDVDVEIGNALEHIEALPKAIVARADAGARFDLAVGAALNKGDKINLLPIELKEKTKRLVENVSLKGIAVGVVVSLLLFYAGMHVQLRGHNKKKDALELEQRTLQPQLDELRKKISINGILKDKPYWEDVLKEISHLVPAEVYLTYLKAEGNTLRLKGDILNSDEGAQAVLSGFMLALEEGIFENVSLVTTQKRPENTSISTFEITCGIE